MGNFQPLLDIVVDSSLPQVEQTIERDIQIVLRYALQVLIIRNAITNIPMKVVDVESIKAKFRQGFQCFKGIPSSGKPSDTGDFGSGCYLSSDKAISKCYGKLIFKVIKFHNPLVLSVSNAYALSTEFGTVSGKRGLQGVGDMAERALRAFELMQAIKQAQFDGLISVECDGSMEVVEYF